MRHKICWLTPDAFVDVDLPIIPGLLKYYDIHWIVVLNTWGSRYKEKDFKELADKSPNLQMEFFYMHKVRDIRSIFDNFRIRKKIKNCGADLNYINYPPSIPHVLPLYKTLPKGRTIVTAHDGSVKSIMKPAWLYRWSMMQGYGRMKYVHMYSQSQAREFDKNFQGHEITIIPLALKDYGCSKISKRRDCISFISFGTIHKEKNVGLLIDAADELYEEGVRGFKISINGVWREEYEIQNRIKHPEIFEVNIGSVPNDAIPNLFGKNHYAVYPYKMMSQSGALKVAYNYLNPVICSNLQGFIDEVEEGVDGYLFESENKESLKSVMKECISKGEEGYCVVREKMAKDISERYSINTLILSYKKMIESVISKK